MTEIEIAAKKLCEKFVQKVESGMARSKETYAECEELLELIEAKEGAKILQDVVDVRNGLRDLVIWMTGCGYDFCQHEYFREKRDKLLK